MNRKLIEEFVGNIVIMTIVIAVIHILNKQEMSCRTLLVDAIAVLLGSGFMTGVGYLFDRKKSDCSGNVKKQEDD